MRASPPSPSWHFDLSIQAAPAPLLAEGPERAFDLMAAQGLTAVHLNSHTYYGGANERGEREIPATWAHDHRPAAMYSGRTSRAWVAHDPADFADLDLPHIFGAPGEPQRDDFGDLVALARARGLRIHARYLDGWGNSRMEYSPQWADVACVGLDGSLLPIPCFANERVQEWWRRTAADIVTRHPEIEGVFYGIERGSVLADMLLQHGQPAYCFCGSCAARARAAGIDMARVRAGFAELTAIMDRAKAGQPERDGRLVAALRVLFRTPEVLLYDRLERAGVDAMQCMGYEAVKAARPEACFSAICHVEMDPFKAVNEDWREVARDADQIVLRLYHDINGARLADMAVDRQSRGTIFDEFSAAWRTELAYGMAVPGSGRVPPADVLREDGLPAATAQDHVRQCATDAGGRPVYAGVGVDISYPFVQRRATPPEKVADLVHHAMAGGARGILLCREYPEISGASMRVAAQALKAAREAAGRERPVHEMPQPSDGG